METKALIIGKFMPLHKGHVNMILSAADKYDNVDVCLLYHDDEDIKIAHRMTWLQNEFRTVNNINICSLRYDPNVLNSSSESDLISSQQWWDYLKKYFTNTTHIVGSEKYVQYMAEYAGLDYEIFDEQRNIVPISATEIRKDFVKNWHYLANSVQRDLALYICVCGTESSGKTTLCNIIAKQLGYVPIIPEIGRCLIANAETMSYYDLMTMFKIHNELLHASKRMPASPIILWDTDNITTISYCKHFIDDETHTQSDFLKNMFEIPLADEYVFLNNSILYAATPDRISEDEANKLKETHIQAYKTFLYKKYNKNCAQLLNVKEYFEAEGFIENKIANWYKHINTILGNV